MPSSAAFLRQISGKEAWKSASMRWATENNHYSNSEGYDFDYGGDGGLSQMEGFNSYGCEANGGGFVMRKRVMVVVDQTSHSKHAMMWALTHVANKGDMLTLLHIIPPNQCSSDSNSSSSASSASACSPYLASSLGSLCKACKPEVEVEALVIQGPKLATVMSQVKKLEVSVLVLGQKKPPSLLLNCLCGGSRLEEFVEECINTVDCLTIGVRKQSKGMGGYLISTRWQKNFWLLA
ncbi:OLC1v1015397C1 [Oldenlandia corymbosa var. corymbosa]|uniref:OLC1v1015397C1 n=1 Tax=Oldenlandia corymbosa var. corymbosa TaxID=529605 RepID=A0AAV1E6I8_OLDCO|nr:OLC1v1015397C1 [Oldenlandia corymbosa var. corymbosa]